MKMQNSIFLLHSKKLVSFELIDNVYEEWKQFFNSKDKYNYTFNADTQDGFFPFRSESAKDNPIKDLKEFFHVYPNSNLPNYLSSNTRLLYTQLTNLGNMLLGWLDELTPENIQEHFSESLFNMVKGSDRNLLRVLHYPPIEEKIEKGAIRAAAHEDINLITLLVSGS